MKIIQPSFEIWEQPSGFDGVYKQIERVGRVCYKSEDRITETSAGPFVDRLIQAEHYAMLEHATVYLMGDAEALTFYRTNKFSKVNEKEGKVFVTTNYRVIKENKRDEDVEKYLCDYTPDHELRVTVHFTTQIGTTREYNRHRVNSMAEQSTRYCNYSKNKFGSEISVNLPVWVKEEEDYKGEESFDDHTFVDLMRDLSEGRSGEWSKYKNWVFANLAVEHAYMNLIKLGCKPQEARAILPLNTNTELVHTAFVSDWLHFFDLRALGTTGAPHPDAKILAEPLMEEFKSKGWI